MNMLFDNFDLLAESPEGIKKLREMILQFAVQGKLTENWRRENPNVEPASVLLEKIRQEKEKLIAEGKIKKQKPLPPITDAEKPFELPEGWEWSRLGDIGSTNVGLTYKPTHICNDGVPVLRSSNIQNGKIDLVDLVRVSTAYNEKDIIKNGDLLICARNGSRKLVGKCAILEGLQGVYTFGAFMAIFRSNFNHYVKLFINSPLYRSKLDGVETTTINQITQSNLKSTIFPTPPLNEQNQIVAKVDSLMALCDRLEKQQQEKAEKKLFLNKSSLHALNTSSSKQEFSRNWQHITDNFDLLYSTPENVNDLKQTILQLAVQGKLTEKWRRENPDVEPASVLLEKIRQEKEKLIADGKIKKQKPLPPITDAEKPFELPEGWEWCKIGEIGNIFGGKRIPKGHHFSDSITNYRYLTVTNMKNGTIIDNNPKYINHKTHEIIKKYTISKDDIYITIAGTIGAVGIIPSEYHDMNLTENAAKFVFSNLNKNLLIIFLKSLFVQNQWISLTNKLAQPKLSLRSIQSTIFPLPSVCEQNQIVAKVDSLMALCDTLEKQQWEKAEKSQKLFNAILNEIM